MFILYFENLISHTENAKIEVSENKISLGIIIIISSFKVNHKISFHDIVTL